MLAFRVIVVYISAWIAYAIIDFGPRNGLASNFVTKYYIFYPKLKCRSDFSPAVTVAGKSCALPRHSEQYSLNGVL